MAQLARNCASNVPVDGGVGVDGDGDGISESSASGVAATYCRQLWWGDTVCLSEMKLKHPLGFDLIIGTLIRHSLLYTHILYDR
jgi:hypothetical protein